MKLTNSFPWWVALAGLVLGPLTKASAQTVANSSFETPFVSHLENYFSFQIDPPGATWVFTGQAGIAENYSGYVFYRTPGTPIGDQFAFLQEYQGTGGAMAQTISGFVNGAYVFTFIASQRDIPGRDNTTNQSVAVSVDGMSVGTFTPADTNWYFFKTMPITLSAGTHTVSFATVVTNGDDTILIDGIGLTNSTTVNLQILGSSPTGSGASSLIFATNGNMYGTTQSGGTNNSGSVFQVTSAGIITTVASLNGDDGLLPENGVVQGVDGNFYSTAAYGGTKGDGTIFSMTPSGDISLVYSFTNGLDGAHPNGVVQAANGNLYATTYEGGQGGAGTIIEVSAGVATVLVSFKGADGQQPAGGPLVSGLDGNLYGATWSGGTGRNGTVFRISPSGAFSDLYSFTNGMEGSNPNSGLIQASDGNFYGTTFYGGPSGSGPGTLFKMTPNGSLSVLYYFTNSQIASYPSGGVTQGFDGNFYGSAPNGGATGQGSLFNITPSGVAKNLYSFTNGADGNYPTTPVQASDGNFYGTCSTSNGGWVVWRLSGFAPYLVTAPGNATNLAGATAAFSVTAGGSAPVGYQWQFDGTNLTDNETVSGSQSNILTLTNVSAGEAGSYRVIVTNADGAITSAVGTLTLLAPLTITNLFYFNGTNGSWPTVLIQGTDGSLYGVTEYGGDSYGVIQYGSFDIGNGTVFSVKTNGIMNWSFSFDGTNGDDPLDIIQGRDGNLYGVTTYGGTGFFTYGNVFSMTTNGNLNWSFDFDGANGAGPTSLIQGRDGNLYGTAGGGVSGYGTVFSLTTGGSLNWTFSFNQNNGAQPVGGLIQGTDGNLYGATASGGLQEFQGASSYYPGTLFSISTGGNLNWSFPFNGSNGNEEYGGLIQGRDGNLYGTTYYGGINSYTSYGIGTVFSVSTSGHLNWSFAFDKTNGTSPDANLIQGQDGNLYGTTQAGGTGSFYYPAGSGTVFSLTTNGTFVWSFSFAGNGENPSAIFQGRDGSLYGTIADPDGNQDVFGVTTNGSPDFLIVDAYSPGPALLLQGADGNLYGGTLRGGIYNQYSDGNLFATTGSYAASFIYLSPVGQTNELSESTTFSVLAGGSPPPSYQWQLNGTNVTNNAMISGAQSSTLTIADGLAVDAGGYQVIVTGVSGSITSAVVNLTIVPLTVAPVAQTTEPGSTVTFGVVSNGFSSLAYQWQLNGTNLANTANFSGALSDSLTVSNAAENDVGSYRVIVTGVSGSVTSTVATLSVLIPGPMNATFALVGPAGGLAELTQGTNGLFYSTTSTGGTSNLGTVLAVDQYLDPATILWNFAGAPSDGANPVAGVQQASNGVFYGTTRSGGSSNLGTVFKLNQDGTGYGMIWQFTNSTTNGAHPLAGLVQGTNGLFYGTTYSGGKSNFGTLFSLNPNGSGYTVLHSFTGTPSDGANPSAALIQLSGGLLCGTTAYGGNHNLGTAFELNLSGGSYQIIHNFSGATNDGANPEAALLQGADGALYGTTYSGGISNAGVVFQIGAGGAGTYTNLYSFINFYGDGANPEAALAQGLDGVLYGTTANGGVSNLGTVFALNTDGSGYTNFYGTPIANPDSALVQGSNGLFYGASSGNSVELFSFVSPYDNYQPLGFVTVSNLQTNNSGYFEFNTTSFTATVQVGNSGLFPEWATISVMATPGQSYSQNSSPLSPTPPNQLLAFYYVPYIIPGGTTNITVSGVCPGPDVIDPANLGIGWGVYISVQEGFEVGFTGYYDYHSGILFDGTWPAISGAVVGGPSVGVTVISPTASSGGKFVFNYDTINGPLAVPANSTANYSGTINLENALAVTNVNFTNTLWTVSPTSLFSISSNGVFTAGTVATNTPVTISAYYSFGGSNYLVSTNITVFGPPTLSHASFLQQNRISFILNGQPQTKYVLQTATNLSVPTTWTSVVTNTNGVSGQSSFTNTILSNMPALFYRAVQLP